MHPRNRIMKNAQKGFTLIELVLVLAGIVLGTMFLPAVQSNNNPRVQCDTRVDSCEMAVGRKAGG
jgi:prepilin-type N-terminal cleavage/methylation domain-containing protein